MKQLSAMLVKNIQLLLRAKAGLVILLLGPLLLVIIAGVAFDHSEPFAINVGVYSSSFSETADAFVDRLTDANFAVETYESGEDCSNAIKTGQEDACILFPVDFDGSNPEQTVEFTVDFNQVNLVNHILNVFEAEVSKTRDEARRRMATSLIEAVNVAKTEVKKDKPLLVGLATGVEAIKNDASDASAALQDVNIIATTATATPDVNESIGELFNTLIFDTNASLEDLKTDIAEAMNETNDTVILDELEDLNDSISTIQSDLHSQETTINSRLSNLTSATNALAKQLGAVVGQLATLQAQKDQVQAKLGSVESRVQDNLVIALKLQESVNKLSTSLEGLTVSSVDQIARPFRTVVNPVSAKQTYLAYLFPSLVVLMAMFGALLIGPSLVHVELASPALIRNRLANKRVLFFAATLLTVLVAVAAQLLIVYGAALFFLEGVSYVAIAQSALIGIGTAIFFAGIGLAIGYFMKSEASSLTTAVAAAAIMLFSSNILLPIETMPVFLRGILAYNPLTFSESIIRNMILYNNPFTTFIPSIGLGIFACAGAVALAFFAVRRKL